MTLKTRPVRLSLLSLLSAPLAGAKINAQLSLATPGGVVTPAYEIDGVDVVPLVVTLTEDPAKPGDYLGNFWPNTRGTKGTRWLINVATGELLIKSFNLTVIDASAAVEVPLSVMINAAPYPQTFPSGQVVGAAQAYADAAGYAAGLALAAPANGLAAADAALQAIAAKVAAESARDASFVTGPKYDTEALGRAAVADGVNFMVQGAGDVAAYEYRRVTAGVAATLIATYASAAHVDLQARRNDQTDAIALSLASQGVDTTLAGSNLSIGSTRFNNLPAPTNCVLNAVAVKVLAPGTFSFVVARRQVNDVFLLTSFLSKVLVATTHSLTSKDFGVVELLAGDLIGVYSADGYCAFESTAVGGGSYVIAGLPAGATAATDAGAVRIGLNAVFADKLAKNTAAALAADLPGVVTLGSAAVSGSAAGLTSARVKAATVATDAILTALNIYVMAAGDGVATVKVFAPTGVVNLYSVVGSEVVSGLVVGKNRVLLASLLKLTPGCLIGIYAKSLTVAFAAGGGADYTQATDGDTTGAAGLGVSTHRWNFNGEILSAGSLRYRSELAYRTLQSAAPSGESQLVFDASLAGSLPAYMQTAGAWSQTTEGVQATGAGAWTTCVEHKNPSTLDRFRLVARVKINSITSIFSLVARGLDTNGSAFEVDGAAGLLKAYPAWNSAAGDPAAATVTQAIGFALVAGREYSVGWAKEIVASAVQHRFSIADTVTQQKSELTTAWLSAGGSGWGKKGVVFRSGNVTVKRLSYLASMPAKAMLAVYGDSRVEGSGYPNNRNDRWHQLVSAAIGGSVFVSGMGGANSTQLTVRFAADYLPFSPRFVLLSIGTNDTDLAVWKANILSMATLILAKNGTPVLATLPPHAAVQTFINSANAWILASGYRYIDFAAALTLNSDRVTWRPGLNDGDLIHENTAGHLSNYAQAQIDLPEIFA